jgi:hypothetical protein
MRLGDAINWSQRTVRIEGELTREQATEYIRNSLGYPISDSTLQLNQYGAGPKLRFGRKGSGSRSEVYYTEEWCRDWVEERRALGLIPASFAPNKHKPTNVWKCCPSDYKLCGIVKHKDCEKYARARCNFTHLHDCPTDPKVLSQRKIRAAGWFEVLWAGPPRPPFGFFSLSGRSRSMRLFQWPARRPDKDAKASYLAAWQGI